MSEKRINIVTAAFGDPLSDRTNSGVPRHLSDAMRSYAQMVGFLSTKNVCVSDVFNGAVDWRRLIGKRKLGLNPNWIWKRSTFEALSGRFAKQLREIPQVDAVLEIGTNVRVDVDGVVHVCRTDMTIQQGYDSKQFSVARMHPDAVEEAVETQRLIFEDCRAIFVTSEWVKKSITDDYGIDGAKVHVIGAGASIPTDLDITRKQPSREILFIGRDWQRKGGPVVLEAFRKVRKACRDATLSIIGCTPQIDEANVNVMGYFDKRDPQQAAVIREALERASVLCVPSTFEPFGLCFLEAQFYGAVPVTFEGEGRAEAIADGRTGFLLQQRTPDAVADAILSLLEDPEKNMQMARAGHAWVKENFTWDVIARKIVDVMENC